MEGIARRILRQLNGEIKKFNAINSTLISVFPSRNDIYFSEKILYLQAMLWMGWPTLRSLISSQ